MRSSRWASVRAAPLDRVPDHAVQHRPVDLALDQVVLRSGPHRLLAEVLARLPGQHDDGRLGLDAQQLPQPLQALRVGQAQVEQHAGRVRDQRGGLAEGPGPLHHDRGVHLQQELLDEQGVAVVVFDEQDRHLVVAARSGGGIKLSVTCHRYLHRGSLPYGRRVPKFLRTYHHARPPPAQETSGPGRQRGTAPAGPGRTGARGPAGAVGPRNTGCLIKISNKKISMNSAAAHLPVLVRRTMNNLSQYLPVSDGST